MRNLPTETSNLGGKQYKYHFSLLLKNLLIRSEKMRKCIEFTVKSYIFIAQLNSVFRIGIAIPINQIIK